MAQFVVLSGRNGHPVDQRSIRAVSRAMVAPPEVYLARNDLAVLVSHARWEDPPAVALHRDGHVGSVLLGPVQDEPQVALPADMLLGKRPSLSSALWPSLAIAWDERRGRVLNDPMGFRAVWWTTTTRCAAIGSTPALLLAHPDVQRRPNLGVIGERLSYRPTSRSETVYEGLRLLGPGGMLTVQSGAEPAEAFWNRWDRTVDHESSFDEFASEILRLTTRVIDSQMVNRRSTSCALHLSGGLDSSSIAGVLHAGGYDDGMVAATRNFPGLPTDETAFQNSVLEGMAFTHSSMDALDFDLERDLIEPTERRGLPIMRTDPARVGASRELSAEGRRVGIIGEGGDELYGELGGSLAHLIISRDFDRARDSLRGLAVREHLREHLDLMPLAVQRQRIRPRPWIRPSFATDVGLAERIVASRAKLGAQGGADARIDEATARGWYPIAAETREADLVEIGTQEVSLFQHPELVQHSVAIPDSCRATAADARALQRHAFSPVLPDALLRRRGKVHFDHRHARDLQSKGIREMLDDMTLEAEGLVDSQPLIRAYDELAAAYADSSIRFPALAGPLWAVVGMEIWFRRFLS